MVIPALMVITALPHVVGQIQVTFVVGPLFATLRVPVLIPPTVIVGSIVVLGVRQEIVVLLPLVPQLMPVGAAGVLAIFLLVSKPVLVVVLLVGVLQLVLVLPRNHVVH